MTERKHFLRPLKGEAQPSRHLFVWIDCDETKPVLKIRETRVWDLIWVGRAIRARVAGAFTDVAGLEAILDLCSKGKGALTIWLARGWEDLVLSGLADMIDRGIITWRYALLDGQRILVRGQWRVKSIVISSLANWTSQRFDSWPKVTTDGWITEQLQALQTAIPQGHGPLEGSERRALATWLACAGVSGALRCTSLAPTVAGAGMQVWRRWLGPRFALQVTGKGKGKKQSRPRMVQVVAPSPFRPDNAALAERHVCYGLWLSQLRQGKVDETVYCLDLRNAYALALSCTPLPISYAKTLHRPSASELQAKLAKHTGLALVRLQTPDTVYPLRRHGKVIPAKGDFWTWLCGHELCEACLGEHVRECHTAYIWHGQYLKPSVAAALLELGWLFEQNGHGGLGTAWRSVYSALVGQFAGRRKHWVDLAPDATAERWCQWPKIDHTSGRLTTCRCVAGRRQELREICDRSDSVPLLYGVITSCVRWIMGTLMRLAGVQNCIQVVADSLWLTQAGWQALQRGAAQSGHAPDSLRTKAIFDRLWLDGKSACVCERNGERILRVPGLKDGSPLPPEGRVRQIAALPWDQAATLDPAAGVPRHVRSFNGQKLMDRFGYPADMLPWGQVFDDPLLPEELLEPARFGRSVADE